MASTSEEKTLSEGSQTPPKDNKKKSIAVNFLSYLIWLKFQKALKKLKRRRPRRPPVLTRELPMEPPPVPGLVNNVIAPNAGAEGGVYRNLRSNKFATLNCRQEKGEKALLNEGHKKKTKEKIFENKRADKEKTAKKHEKRLKKKKKKKHRPTKENKTKKK